MQSINQPKSQFSIQNSKSQEDPPKPKTPQDTKKAENTNEDDEQEVHESDPKNPSTISRLPAKAITQLIQASNGEQDKQTHLILQLKKRKEEFAKILLRNLKNNQFFKQYVRDFDDDQEIDPFVFVCKNIKLKKYKAGDIVMQQGEVSDGRVYLVYKGDLLVIVKSTAFIANETAAAQTPPKNQINIVNYLKNKDTYQLPEEANNQFDFNMNSKRGSSRGGLDSSRGKERVMKSVVSQFQNEFVKESRRRTSVKPSPLLFGASGGDPLSNAVNMIKKGIQRNSTFGNNTSMSELNSPDRLSGISTPLQRNSAFAQSPLQIRGMSTPKSNLSIQGSEQSPYKKKSQFGGMVAAAVSKFKKQEQLEIPIDQNQVDEEGTSAMISSARSSDKSEFEQDNSSNSQSKGIKNHRPMALNLSLLKQISQKQQQQQPQKSQRGKNVINIGVTATEFGVVKDMIKENGYFGDRASIKTRRQATIIASTDVELLIISAEDADYIKNKYDHTKKQFIKFVNKAFGIPNFNQNPKELMATDTLLYLLQVQEFDRMNKITTQAEAAENIYLINEGECEIVKHVVYDSSQNLDHNLSEIKGLYGLKKTSKEEIAICTIQPGTFFGLESLFENNGYRYTVRVVSDKAKVLTFSKQKIQLRCQQSMIDDLHKIMIGYERNNLNILKLKLQVKKIDYDENEILKPHPILFTSKKPNHDFYLQNLLALDREKKEQANQDRILQKSKLSSSMPELLIEPSIELPSAHVTMKTVQLKQDKAQRLASRIPSPNTHKRELKNTVNEIEKLDGKTNQILGGTASVRHSGKSSPVSRNQSPLRLQSQNSSQELNVSINEGYRGIYQFQDSIVLPKNQSLRAENLSPVMQSENLGLAARRESATFQQRNSPEILEQSHYQAYEQLRSTLKQSSIMARGFFQKSMSNDNFGKSSKIMEESSQSKIMRSKGKLNDSKGTISGMDQNTTISNDVDQSKSMKQKNKKQDEKKKKRQLNVPHQIKSVHYQRVSSQKPEQVLFQNQKFKKAQKVDEFFNNFIGKVKDKYGFIHEVEKDNHQDFINNIKNFKLNFERGDKIMDKRYKKIQLELQGIYKNYDKTPEGRGMQKSILKKNAYADLAELGARKFQESMKKSMETLDFSDDQTLPEMKTRNPSPRNSHFTTRSDFKNLLKFSTSPRTSANLKNNATPDMTKLIKLSSPKASVSGFTFRKFSANNISSPTNNDISQISGGVSPFVITGPTFINTNSVKNINRNHIQHRTRMDSSLSLDPINTNGRQNTSQAQQRLLQVKSMPNSPKRASKTGSLVMIDNQVSSIPYIQ